MAIKYSFCYKSDKIMEEKNPYIQQVANDYDMNYADVAFIYKHYSKNFFEKLEEFIKDRANE